MIDLILILSLISIWIAVFEAILFMFGATTFVNKQISQKVQLDLDEQLLPKVTVIIPAHNEEIVIGSTVQHVLQLNYPKHKLQLIVVADNCTDATAKIVEKLKREKQDLIDEFIMFERTGTGGKSGALNAALPLATGEWVCIYDADAAPEKNALYFLIQTALENVEEYGAVIGRNKARNRMNNWLTQFINLELITMQRIHHTALWQLFKIGTIPGTNYIIQTALVRELGGWNEQAITEDTAISFELLKRGKLIALAPRAEAYQQEPERLSIYMKQRERWAKGNYEVITDHFHHLFRRSSWRIKGQILYYATSYFWFMIAIIISDILLLVNAVYLILSLFNANIVSPFQFANDLYIYLMISWALMYYLYVLQINLALVTDIGQSTIRNFLLSCISYFTYAQLFLIISVKVFFTMIKDKLLKKKQTTWYKTERFR